MNLLELDNYVTSRYISEFEDMERRQHINEIYLDLTRVFTPDSIEELYDPGEVATQAGVNSFIMPVAARKVAAVFVEEQAEGYTINDKNVIDEYLLERLTLKNIKDGMGITEEECMDIFDTNQDGSLDITDTANILLKINRNSARKRLKMVNKNAITHPQQRGAGYNAETEKFFKRVGTDNILLKTKRWAFNRMVQSGGKNRIEVIFDPVPRGSIPLYIRYEPIPELLADNTDVPQYIPEEYHYLIAWGAIALLASQPGTEDWNVAQAWEARFRAGVNEMLQILGLTSPDNYPSIVMIGEWEAAKNV